jgi:predicted phage terminase large subunit-like protein
MSFPEQLSREQYRFILRNDFSSFIERSFAELNPGMSFMPAPYIDLLASTLDACRTGATKRLIVNLPPRTLKSHAASVALPAWLLGHDPAKQIICASYGQDLADKHARDSKTVMTSPFFRNLFPQTHISRSKSSVSDFATTAHGFRMSTSVRGVLTGRGGDVLILDDILKPDEARSEVSRNAANDWYFNTLLSRLNSKKNGVIILVMQRLHQDDLVGRVLECEPGWKALSLPAIAPEDEDYRYRVLFCDKRFQRKAGVALHPERDSLETLERIRQTIGEYNFQSQYQQSPITLEGNLIKREWLQFYDQPPTNYCFTLQSWDTASKTEELNDFSVCTTWRVSNQNLYLIDVFRKRLTFPQLKHASVEVYRRFSPNRVLIEDKASGTALIQDLRSTGILGIEPYVPAPGSDKQMRFAAQSIKFEAGRVFLPRRAAWLDEYVREITGFPGCKYDDQVDSTSQALHYLVEKGNPNGFLDLISHYARPRGYEAC